VLIAVGFCFLQPAVTRSLWWQQAQNEEKDSSLQGKFSALFAFACVVLLQIVAYVDGRDLVTQLAFFSHLQCVPR
jgi:hypothetical protein